MVRSDLFGRAAMWFCVGVAICLVASPAWAQRTRNRNGFNQQQNQQDDGSGNQDPNQQQQEQNQNQNQDAGEKKDVKIPNDPRLLEVHKQFIINAEKLAADYIKKNELDKARVCYEEVVRLVPTYAKGQENLEDIKQRQAVSERKQVTIMATDGWQDTGVVVAEGKPVVISASGEWNFRVSQDLSADGMEVPKDLQDFNLGSLVGMIEDGNPKDNKPFFVGSHLPFTARRTGRLMLRMYDADPSDNLGKLQVTITGSFASGGKRASSSSTTSN